MYHSIKFGDKNTWTDWHLIPTSAPVFKPPAVQTNFIDVPGMSGSLDLTEALTGYPLFSSREGSFEFLVINDFGIPWDVTYTMIANYLHGQAMDAVLEDDPQYYYRGRFSLNDYKSEKDWDKIVIDYHVDPYKWGFHDWLWDPFSFIDGVIRHGYYEDPVTGRIYRGSGLFENITVTSEGTPLAYTTNEVGTAPTSVTFTAGDEYGISLVIPQLTNPVIVAAGTSEVVRGLVLYKGSWLYNGRPSSVTAYPYIPPEPEDDDEEEETDPEEESESEEEIIEAPLSLDFVFGDF